MVTGVAALMLLVATTEPQQAILRLIVNDADQGDVLVMFVGETVWVSKRELDAADVPGDAVREGAPTPDRRWVTLASLAPAVESVVDREALALRLRVHPSLMPRTMIAGSAGAPPDLERRSDLGFFLNYAPRVSDFQRIEASFEAGGSFAALSATTTVTAAPERGIVRGLSAASYDFPDQMLRLAGGDVLVTSGALGGGVLLGGLSLTRSFELNPYFTAQPTFGSAGTALTPSRLDVYVNGVRVRSKDIPAGPYELNGVPLAAGGGDVKLVLRDAFGNEQVLRSPYYSAATALARGLHDFQYAVGLVREGFGKESFAYSEPAVVARHQMGVLRWLTLGANLEASLDVIAGGPSAVVVTPLGQLDLTVAASAADGSSGVGAIGGITYSSRAFGAGVRARAMSAGYANLSLAPAEDRRIIDGAVFASLPIFRFMSVSSQLQGYLNRDDGASGGRLDLGFSTALFSSAFLALTVSQGVERGAFPTSVFATVSGSLDGHTASIGSRAGPERLDGFVDASRSLPLGAGFGYRAHVEGSEEHVAGDVTGQVHVPVARADATVGFIGDQVHSALEVAGSIAYVAGAGLFFARPLRGAYAVLRVPGAAGVRGFVNNQEVGVTDGDGDLLVPDLLPYYGNRLRVADDDLPFNYAIEGGERIVAPTQRGAALVLLSARRVHFARGRIVVAGGSPSAARYGQLTMIGDNDDASPLGADGEFEIEGLSSGDHLARVEHEAGDCEALIRIPSDTEEEVWGVEHCPTKDNPGQMCWEVTEKRPRLVIELGEVSCTP